MPLILDPNGLQTQTQEEIAAELTAKLRATFGVNLNTLPESIMGQLVNIVSEFRAVDQQALLAVYRTFDPNTALGVQLDARAALTGSVRKGSTNSTVFVEFEFTGPGIVNDGDLFLNQDTLQEWAAINGPYTDTGGPYPEIVQGQLQAVEAGPLIANAGTTWTLVTANPALAGLANPSDDANPGRLQESDPDFRVRRQIEKFSQNQGPLAAIRGVVSKVDGVETVRVYHNPAINPVDANGIPFKAFNVVVATNPSPPPAALQQTISDAIFSAMGAGGEAFGTDYNLIVVDDEGQPQPDIRFDLEDEVPVFINLAISTAGTEQPVSENIKEVVEAEVLAVAQRDFSGLGQNQLAFQYSAIVSDLQARGEITGVVAVSVTLSRIAQGGPFADPVEIGIRERPVFDSPRIVATVTP